MQRFGAILSNSEAEKTIWRTSDETVNNSATLQDDDVLTIALASGTLYYFDFEFFWSTTSTADFRFLPGYSGTTSLVYAVSIFTNPGATATISGTDATWKEWLCNGGSGTIGWGNVRGILVTTSTGNLKLTWAQGTATAVDTKVLAGSRLKVTKLAAG